MRRGAAQRARRAAARSRRCRAARPASTPAARRRASPAVLEHLADGDAQQARGRVAALAVAAEPEQVLGGARGERRVGARRGRRRRPCVDSSENSALTGPSASTQVSFERPPRCIAITGESSSPATRVRPPGMTRQPLGVATAKTRRPTVRARARGARRCVAAPRAPAPARRAPTPARRSAAAARADARAQRLALASAERSPTTIDGSLGERSIGLMISRSGRRHASSNAAGSPQPPGRDRRQLQRLAEQLAAEARQVAEQRARLEHARAERVGEQHVAAARAVGQAGDAERGIGAQLERVAVVVVLAAHDRVDALQAVDASSARRGRRAPSGRCPRRARSRGSARAARARSRSRCTARA